MNDRQFSQIPNFLRVVSIVLDIDTHIVVSDTGGAEVVGPNKTKSLIFFDVSKLTVVARRVLS